MLDYIIIGAGPAGLYAGLLLSNQHKTFKILERNKKAGGRVGNKVFGGVEIVKGAGVGREEKDHTLKTLLQEIGLSPGPRHLVKKQFAFEDKVSMKRVLRDLQKHHYTTKQTFRQYAMAILGKKRYDAFVKSTGYSDFENMGAREAMTNYGFEDDDDGWTTFQVPWKKMIERLCQKIGLENIMFGQNVSTLRNLDDVVVTTEEGMTLKAKHCILATDICTLKRLLPNFELLKLIEGQPFLRVYGIVHVDDRIVMAEKVKTTTIVGYPLYKIIPIDVVKGVYMIAYCDNAGAIALKSIASNTAEHRRSWQDLLKTVLGIEIRLDCISSFYWPIGTHYYKPLEESLESFLRKVQHPANNIQICGEVVATNQGWTSSALDSVKRLQL